MRRENTIQCAVLIALLGPSVASGAKPGRRPDGRSSRSPVSDGRPLIEVEPSTGPAVMRDPAILGKAEMLSLVRKYADDITSALVDGDLQREAAAHTRDVIKLTCIQDRLSNMKRVKSFADQSLTATARDDIQADDLNLRHEFRGVELAHERVAELHRELLECVGESLEVVLPPGDSGGPTGVTASGDPAATHVEIPTVDRPPPASAYR